MSHTRNDEGEIEASRNGIGSTCAKYYADLDVSENTEEINKKIDSPGTMQTTQINEEQHDTPIDEDRQGFPIQCTRANTEPSNHQGFESTSSMEQASRIPELTMVEIRHAVGNFHKRKAGGRERNQSRRLEGV